MIGESELKSVLYRIFESMMTSLMKYNVDFELLASPQNYPNCYFIQDVFLPFKSFKTIVTTQSKSNIFLGTV